MSYIMKSFQGSKTCNEETVFSTPNFSPQWDSDHSLVAKETRDQIRIQTGLQYFFCGIERDLSS